LGLYPEPTAIFDFRQLPASQGAHGDQDLGVKGYIDDVAFANYYAIFDIFDQQVVIDWQELKLVYEGYHGWTCGETLNQGILIAEQ
jgi:hypothetical protein